MARFHTVHNNFRISSEVPHHNDSAQALLEESVRCNNVRNIYTDRVFLKTIITKLTFMRIKYRHDLI